MKYSTKCFMFGVGMLAATNVGQWLVIAHIANGTTQRFIGAAVLLGVCSSVGSFTLGGVYKQYAEG